MLARDVETLWINVSDPPAGIFTTSSMSVMMKGVARALP